MKKFLFLLVFLTLIGCAKSSKNILSDWIQADGCIRVLSTTAMIEDIVKQIGGEFIRSICLIVGDLDPHSYELVKGDDEKFRAADLIFCNGIGLEHSASIRYHLENNKNTVTLGDQLLQKYPDRFVLVDGQLDPHIWMDMDLFSEIVDPIVEALISKDPMHATDYEERGKQVKAKLKYKDIQLRHIMRNVPKEKRFLVTSHDAFHYFAKRYLALEENENWEQRVQAPEGLAPDGQMSVFDIQKVTEFLCENHIHIVFPETNVNRDSLRKIVQVCRSKGLVVEVSQAPLYGDTMAGVNSYIEMMEYNVKTLSSCMMGEI